MKVEIEKKEKGGILRSGVQDEFMRASNGTGKEKTLRLLSPA